MSRLISLKSIIPVVLVLAFLVESNGTTRRFSYYNRTRRLLEHIESTKPNILLKYSLWSESLNLTNSWSVA